MFANKILKQYTTQTTFNNNIPTSNPAESNHVLD